MVWFVAVPLAEFEQMSQPDNAASSGGLPLARRSACSFRRALLNGH
jgi:hypothetical protein